MLLSNKLLGFGRFARSPLFHSPANVAVLRGGVGGNPIAPLWAAGDTDPTHSDALGGTPVYSWAQPSICKCNNGDLLAFAAGYRGSSDWQNDRIGMRRSTDGGLNWSAIKLVYLRTDYASNSKSLIAVCSTVN